MKIQCDVCDKNEASVFCVADEAALCANCDQRVHHANELTGKHQRFTLHNPSNKQAPICDICQERRAFLFCHQDRAILCKECDVSVHKANELTKKHTRFLLTGVKLSSTSSLYSASPSSSESVAEDGISNPARSHNPKNRPHSGSTPFTLKSTTFQCATEFCDKRDPQSTYGSIPTSSISEYLMETLPGWHVEDFLDSSNSLPYGYGFSKNGENDVLPFLDADLQSAFPAGKMGFWVPQMPNTLHQTQNQSSFQSIDIAFCSANANGFKDQSMEFAMNNIKSSRKWNEDNSFAVPQMSTSPNTSKRYRNYW